jgi:hypothetical protein
LLLVRLSLLSSRQENFTLQKLSDNRKPAAARLD